MGWRYTSDRAVKDGLYSFAFGILFTLLLFLLLPVSERVAQVSIWLIGIPSYLVFWRPWFGLDCANADDVANELRCVEIMVTMAVLFYWMIGFSLLALSHRFRKSKAIEPEVRGQTLGIN